MLADSSQVSIQSGSFDRHIHLQSTSRYELLKFIARQLPDWRDHKDRPKETAETSLTDHLCGYLTSAARRCSWDFIQFRTEVPDEKNKGRKIDLVPKPCDATIWIEGRRHTQFDSIMPIECKRLPTPVDNNRDEREYVVSRYSSTGGIQRFKEGHHGSQHQLGAIIGYIQDKTTDSWFSIINDWIQELADDSSQVEWSTKDLLQEDFDVTQNIFVVCSIHKRSRNLPDIELRHLWIVMNVSEMEENNEFPGLGLGGQYETARRRQKLQEEGEELWPLL